jgi:hypothetical protein
MLPRKLLSKLLERIIFLSFEEFVRQSVCDACQQAKSHQLPYSSSMRASKFSLELVYSDVWGPAT